MKTIIKGTILLFACIFFTACHVGRPLQTQISDNNRTFEVDYLFEHDGVKVYRFYDHGNYVYFTNRSGEVTRIDADSAKNRTITIGR